VVGENGSSSPQHPSWSEKRVRLLVFLLICYVLTPSAPQLQVSESEQQNRFYVATIASGIFSPEKSAEKAPDCSCLVSLAGDGIMLDGDTSLTVVPTSGLGLSLNLPSSPARMMTFVGVHAFHHHHRRTINRNTVL
jgi:hypothetical protein